MRCGTGLLYSLGRGLDQETWAVYYRLYQQSGEAEHLKQQPVLPPRRATA
jgi:hypothetical protein